MNVIIPTSLRQHTGGASNVTVEGKSVERALSELVGKFPELESHLFHQSGSLVTHMNVFVNDENIRDLDHVATALNENDEILLVPAIAGG